ncbi:MAG: hypothetical protein NWE98_07145 [Candidatus Bathyarchaeota archaeon]|nr:hypothetical protein [Candidatus Bathyarchaeota archaeon]
MMMKKLDKKATEFTVNLALLEEDGSFQCPKCGRSISPDDASEETYQIMDTKVVNNELSELIISCGKCQSIIRLTGFPVGFDA